MLESMQETNEDLTKRDGKVPKLLLIVLFLMVFISSVLVGVYLYNRNNIINKGNAFQKNVVLKKSPKTEDLDWTLYSTKLLRGRIGEQYRGLVLLGIHYYNIQVNGKVKQGLPAGLQLEPCVVEYDSPTLAPIGAKNSLVRCIIGGVPQESGDFMIRISFSIPNSVGEVFKDIPLIIDP
jgi:hypothetical protein